MSNYHNLKNFFTLEGVVSHKVLFYQQLSIARYHKKKNYAYNYFE